MPVNNFDSYGIPTIEFPPAIDPSSFNSEAVIDGVRAEKQAVLDDLEAWGKEEDSDEEFEINIVEADRK